MRASVGAGRPPSRRKGLRNDAGANNCFLNVVIQSLWHVRSCRALISAGDHAVHHRCGGDVTRAALSAASASPCLLCELEQIFILYQFSEAPVLDVDRVRRALGDVFALGDMNDATEALEAVLDALHWDTLRRMLALRRQQQPQGGGGDADGAGQLAPHQQHPHSLHQVRHAGELSASMKDDASAIVCEPVCIAHLVFQMNLMELRTCAQCGATAEPLLNTDFLYRVYAQELLQHARTGGGTGGHHLFGHHGRSKNAANGGGRTLEEVLRLEAQGGADSDEGDGQTHFQPACERCRGGRMQPSRWILTLPMVFAVSVVWASDRVDKAEVRAWMELLTSQSRPPPPPSSSSSSSSASAPHNPQTLHLDRIFHLDKASAAAADYAFRGMVCYYGRHYVGFFASHSVVDGVEQERWYLFDDTRVGLVGAWADVRLRVERGGYQPTLLFYERNGLEPTKLEKLASEIHAWWKETADGVAVGGAGGAGAAVGADGGNEREFGGASPQQQWTHIHESSAPASTSTGVSGVGAGVAGVAVIDDDDTDDDDDTLLAVEDNADLLMAMKESLSLGAQAPRSLQLPVSPINARGGGGSAGAGGVADADVIGSAGGGGGGASVGWHDDTLVLMHKSAEDTLSRVNGLLSKGGRAPLSTAAVASEAAVSDLRRTMSMSMRRSVRRRDHSFHSAAQHALEINRDEIFNDVLLREGAEDAYADGAAGGGGGGGRGTPLSGPSSSVTRGLAMPPLSPIRQGIPETMYGFVPSKSAAGGGSSAQQQQPSRYPRHQQHFERPQHDELLFANATSSSNSRQASPPPPPLPLRQQQQSGRPAASELLDAPALATKPFRVVDVELHASDGGVGLVLEAASASWCALKRCESAFVVSGFETNGAGEKLAAEASGAIRVGDVLLAINGRVLASEALYSVLELLWTSPNPVALAFQRLQAWACEKCTLENPAGGFSCGACGHTVQLEDLRGGSDGGSGSGASR